MWRFRCSAIGRIAPAAAFLVVLSASCTAGQPSADPPKATAVASLRVEPDVVKIQGSRSEARLLVTALGARGALQDVTERAVYRADPPGVVRCGPAGRVLPLRDGQTVLTVRYAGRTATARIQVAGAQSSAPVRFSTEVIPILTRAGCNLGTCHGAAAGKGGLKLSLAGFEPDADYRNLVKQARGRRLSVADPARSLLLRKPTMAVPHAGGRRLEPGSRDFNVLIQWMRQGAPGPDPADRSVTRIEVLPADRILERKAVQRLVVRATYPDGTVQDVTSHARLNSLNDAILECTPDGLVTAVGQGQASIMVRYEGQAAVAQFLVPYRNRTGAEPSATPSTAAGSIDALVERKQRSLGLTPSPLCDDLTFLRRVSFDLIGTAPTAEEITAFLADKSPDRRARHVDTLLARPEYADYWTLKWGDLLRSERNRLGGSKGMWSFTNWIRAQLRENRPIDQFVRELVTAQGSTYTNGPSNYYRVVSGAQDLAETTSQIFLGVRLQCARCHRHPFERWSQDDYYQFAAFFARVGLKSSQEFGIFGGEQIVRVNDSGDVRHPKTGAVMPPTPLGVPRQAASGETPQPDLDAFGDRRSALADWLVDKNNRLFARNIANRYWGYLFGIGIVNPIDDQRVTNPPTNRELLERLADSLVRYGYDVKKLLREIVLSKTYQRSAVATPENRNDELYFTHYVPHRLSAESLLDAIDYSCGTQEKYNELPAGTRAIALPDSSVGSDFLDTFGRSKRTIACECERVTEPNLSQTLRLMNGELVNRKVSQGDGRIAKLLAAKRSNDVILRELYLCTVGRMPRPEERLHVMGALAFTSDRKAVFEDVLLTLLNSKEFLFNH